MKRQGRPRRGGGRGGGGGHKEGGGGAGGGGGGGGGGGTVEREGIGGGVGEHSDPNLAFVWHLG